MSFALIRNMVLNRVGLSPEAEFNTPLGKDAGTLSRARVNGVLDVKGAAAAFIMAEANGALFKAPRNLSATILGHGEIVDHPFRIHRFYFTGSAGVGSAENMLQVTTRGGAIEPGETKLFQKMAEINPTTKEEWNAWIIGSVSERPLLTGPTLFWQDQYEFKRVWAPGALTVDPRAWNEALNFEGTPTNVRLSTMLYGRQLAEGVNEWLQLAVCRDSSGTRWIEAYVGIGIDPTEISAI